MITLIEKEFKKRNDKSILFLAHKSSSLAELDDVNNIKKDLDKVISKLQDDYYFQSEREFLLEKPPKNKQKV